jgi:hypothetical protein
MPHVVIIIRMIQAAGEKFSYHGIWPAGAPPR